MKKLMIGICLLVLTGCSTIKPFELQLAEQFCKNKGGIYSITQYMLSAYPSVQCVNGRRDWLTLTKE